METFFQEGKQTWFQLMYKRPPHGLYRFLLQRVDREGKSQLAVAIDFITKRKLNCFVTMEA